MFIFQTVQKFDEFAGDALRYAYEVVMMLFIVRKKWGWAFGSWVKDNDGERETWHVYDRGIDQVSLQSNC